MCLEERIERIEMENAELKNRLEVLERKGGDTFVSVKELASILKCSENTIYQRIRSGDIFATRKTGGIKIPMSQFHEPQKIVHIHKQRKKEERELTLKERVFG